MLVHYASSTYRVFKIVPIFVCFSLLSTHRGRVEHSVTWNSIITDVSVTAWGVAGLGSGKQTDKRTGRLLDTPNGSKQNQNLSSGGIKCFVCLSPCLSICQSVSTASPATPHHCHSHWRPKECVLWALSYIVVHLQFYHQLHRCNKEPLRVCSVCLERKKCIWCTGKYQ